MNGRLTRRVAGPLLLAVGFVCLAACSRPVAPVSPAPLAAGEAVRLSNGVSLRVPVGWNGRMAAGGNGSEAVVPLDHVQLSEQPSSGVSFTAVVFPWRTQPENLLAADKATTGALIGTWGSAEGTVTVSETSLTIPPPGRTYVLRVFLDLADRSPTFIEVDDTSGRASAWTGDVWSDYRAITARFKLGHVLTGPPTK